MLAGKKQPNEQSFREFIKYIEYPMPFVLDANWVNSLGIIHGLAAIELKSIAINHNKWGAGLHSKYTLGFVGPDPWDNPQGLIDLLILLAKELPKKGVLFVTDDKYLEILSKAKQELTPFFHFSFPDHDILEILMDKENQYAAAKEVGLSYPQSLVVQTLEDSESWPANAFPAVVKGVSGKEFSHHFGKQAIEVNDQPELINLIESDTGVDFLVQEKILGGEENLYTLGCYINPDGEAKGVFTGRKLRQYPRYYGTCTVGESVPCQEIIEPGLEMLRTLNFYGIAQVEFKKDSRDGTYKLIEINGRFWKWHSLATACGVNLAACAYSDITGAKEYLVDKQLYGLKWIVLPEDLRGVVKDIQNKEFKLFTWLRTIAPPFVFALFNWQDIRPWAIKMISVFRRGKHR